MRSALRQVREGKRIEKLQTRLSSCQDRLHLALTAEMRDSFLKKLEEQSQNTDSMRSIVLQKLDFTGDQIRTLDKNISQIGGAARKQISELDSRQQKASANLRRGQRDLSQNIDSQFLKLSISSTHKSFLDSLYFPEMFARQESMKKNLPGTYDWVFNSRCSSSDGESIEDDEELRGCISRWLREPSGSPVFWISGKPGSGKSSLMSFIMSDKRTAECLNTWAGNRVPYIFSFFFWKPGSKLQKTVIGFLRSLVWQMCKARPSIIDILLSRDPTLLYSPWTEARLIETLRSAFFAYRNDPLFLVVDGLDECEDNHSDLLDELQVLNSNPYTKICISSRPEQVFCQRLGKLPSARLDDLNYRDICKYALTKLKKGDDRTTRLARHVASKAHGVFLWAVLVCDSLCSGLMAEDDDEILLQRLHTYPKGLDDLFDRMFADIEEVHHESLAFYFYAARQPRFTVALAVASRSTRRIESLEQFGAMCEHEVIRVAQQSKGLLQVCPTIKVSDNGRYDSAWSLKDLRTEGSTPFPVHDNTFRLAKKHLYLDIEYVHRSAYDYIFGDRSANAAGRIAWLRSVHPNEITRKVLNGALWLLQHGPVLHMVKERLHKTNGLSMMLRWALSADDVLMANQEWFCHELETLLGLLQSWTCAVQDNDRMSRKMTRLQLNDSRPPDSQYSLRDFWYDALFISPEFVASHSCRLWDRDDTHLNIAALFNSWSSTRFHKVRYKRGIDSAMFSVATEFHRRGLSRVKEAFPQMQRQCQSIASDPTSFQSEGQLISWKALSTHHEASYVLRLRNAAGRITGDGAGYERDQNGTNGYSPGQTSDRDKCMDIGILETFCALIQGWQLFCGRRRCVQGILLPSKLSVPVLNKYPPASRYLNNAEMERLLSCRAEKRLRLSCFARRGPDTLARAEKLSVPASAIASYCVCSATTNALLMFGDAKDHNSDGTRFVGSVAEMSAVLSS